jgi:ethanolaminephosphotransferase
MQFGNTIFAVLLYIIPTIPFYIIAHEEYYTHEMNLPIVNAAAEGTVSVAVIFAATAYFGTLIFN